MAKMYNLANVLDRQNLKARMELMLRKEALVEFGEVRALQRTTRQNSYLHFCLTYFAALYKEKMEWVKQEYYKKLVNPEIFVRTKQDPFLGEVPELRSSASLTPDEMATSIDRFINWAAREAGYYIPAAQDEAAIKEALVIIQENKAYL